METQYLLFIFASIALIITPGQDLLLVMSRSIGQGPRSGIATAAGVSTGLVGHTILATLGLGAILRTSELLFMTIKFAGAAYLFYLGVKLLTAAHDELHLRHGERKTLQSLFMEGAFSNLSNPKIAIFYFSFLPQFVPHNAQNPAIMMFILGLSFALLTFCIKAPIGYTAGRLSSWLRARPRIQTWINRVSGGVLVGLGIRLALEKRA